MAALDMKDEREMTAVPCSDTSLSEDVTPEVVSFNPVADWPDPDLTICKPERPAAPVMSNVEFQMVFGPLADCITTAADAKGAPVDYVAVALLTTASALIGNSRWAEPWPGWAEPPVLWGMLVGEPSAGKSPALDAVMDSVKQIERKMAENYKVARADWDVKSEIAGMINLQWKSEAKAAIADGNEPPAKPAAADARKPPVRQRITVSDVTTEKLAELLGTTWRGVLLYRDELPGWLGGMDRYSNGGDRPFWLEAYGGRSFSVDRKNNPEPVIVDRLSVAVVGGTQPDKLAELLVKSADDGLLARFMTVFPDPVPLSRPGAIIDTTRLKNALERLLAIPPNSDENGNPRPVFVRFSDAAADSLQTFRGQCREWEGDASGIFKSHLGKLPGIVVRMACVLAHMDYAAQPDALLPNEISASHVERGCHFVGEHLRLHAFRAYGSAQPPAEIRNSRRVARLILETKPRSLTVRSIQHREWSGMQTAKDVTAALHALEEADWLRKIKEPTGGAPRVTYVVNPKLWAKP